MRKSSIMSAITRRSLLNSTALGAAGAATYFGPWRHNRAFAQDRPILIGLTHDASGQFANSGQAERRGTIMAIEEVNEKGCVLGRPV